MKSRAKIKPHQSAILLAGAVSVIALFVPILHRILLPVEYLNTHLHELSHALVAQFTGAQVDQITVNANGSGATPVEGGNIFLIASAGYLGASIFGAAMIFFGRTEKQARATLLIFCALLCFSMVIWVRGDAVGEISGVGWIVGLAVAAMALKGNALLFCCQFLGLQQCLSSVQSVFELVKISSSMEAHSDASILQGVTGVPAIVWAAAWSFISLLLVVWTLKASWQPAKAKPR